MKLTELCLVHSMCQLFRDKSLNYENQASEYLKLYAKCYTRHKKGYLTVQTCLRTVYLNNPYKKIIIGTGCLENSDLRKTQTLGCLENSDPRKTQTRGCLENSDPRKTCLIVCLKSMFSNIDIILWRILCFEAVILSNTG